MHQQKKKRERERERETVLVPFSFPVDDDGPESDLTRWSAGSQSIAVDLSFDSSPSGAPEVWARETGAMVDAAGHLAGGWH